jgi:hypothetical protein
LIRKIHICLCKNYCHRRIKDNLSCVFITAHIISKTSINEKALDVEEELTMMALFCSPVFCHLVWASCSKWHLKVNDIHVKSLISYVATTLCHPTSCTDLVVAINACGLSDSMLSSHRILPGVCYGDTSLSFNILEIESSYSMARKCQPDALIVLTT